MLRHLLFTTLAVATAGCNRSDEGSSVTINADGGTFSGGIDGNTGEMKIDIPGFKGAVTLPKIKFDTGDFDLNGVKLYPGSTIENVNISDGAGTGVSGGSGGIRVRFASPTTPETIRTWFAERLGKAGYSVRSEGANLIGTTDENKPFRLDLTPDGADKAKGTIVIGG